MVRLFPRGHDVLLDAQEPSSSWKRGLAGPWRDLILIPVIIHCKVVRVSLKNRAHSSGQ
jgi:hypothetical protein